MKEVSNEASVVSPDGLAALLQLRIEELAQLVQVPLNALSRSPQSADLQAKLRQLAEILRRATAITEDSYKAVIWFKSARIDTLNNKTPAELVTSGHADAVIHHLELVDNGVYS